MYQYVSERTHTTIYLVTSLYATPSIFTRFHCAGPWPCYSGACLFWIVGIMGKQWLPQPSRRSTGQQYMEIHGDLGGFFSPFFVFVWRSLQLLKSSTFKKIHGIFWLKISKLLVRRNSVSNSSLAICFSAVAILGGKAVALQGMPLTWTWKRRVNNGFSASGIQTKNTDTESREWQK